MAAGAYSTCSVPMPNQSSLYHLGPDDIVDGDMDEATCVAVITSKTGNRAGGI